MSGLFGHKKRPVINVLGGVRAQTSIYGLPIPIVFGRNRIAGNMIWYGDFKGVPISGKGGGTGGKGGLFGAGGKGQKNYDYGAACAIALCQGPIVGIGGVWDTQGTLPVNDTSENYTIGGGFTYTVTQVNTYLNDLGVTVQTPYSVSTNDPGNPYGAIVLSGNQQVPMVKVSSGPTTGQYSESGGVYTFAAADSGKNVTISYQYGPPNTVGSDPIVSMNLTLFNGTDGQAAWGYLTTNHPSQAIGYTDTAYMASQLIDLGSSGAMPNLSFEVLGALQYGSGIFDCNPKDILYTLMTDPLQGCGFVAGDIGDMTAFSNYCVANGIFFSPVMSDQRTAADWFKDFLEAANAEIVLSGGVLKFVPYGDTSVVGNGATFQPSTAPIYDLNDDDFIYAKGEPPIIIERPSVQDAYNAKKIEFVDRGNNYNPQIVEAQDLHGIQQYKYRPDGTKQYHFITTQAVANTVVQTQLSRAVNIRNKFKFKLGQRYILLDPMDIVTVTDANLGLNKLPVRIMAISEDANKILSIEADEFPFGCSGPTLYPKQGVTSGGPLGNADPGSVNTPIIFEAVPRLRGGDPHMELWFCISGSNQNYGGCQAFVSVDGGTTYSPFGTMQGSSVMGVTTADWPLGVDPEVTNDLPVDLTQSNGVLSSVPVATENAFGSLCYVASPSGTPPYELMSYAIATLTAPNKYTLKATGGNFLRRGVFNNISICDHPNGSAFAFIGSNVLVMPFDPSTVGVTLKFKFAAFNRQGNTQQSLAGLTVYSFTPTGLQIGAGAVGYSVSPATAVYQDPTTNTTVDVAPFRISSASGGHQSYLGTSFTGLSNTGLYYVYVYDPSFLGEAVSPVSRTCTYECDTTQARGSQAGWFLVGSVQMSSGAPTGVITSISINAAGSGYIRGDNLVGIGGAGSGATLTVTAVNGSGGVTRVSLTNGGSGYVTATGVSTTGGSGSGLTININAVSGSGTPSAGGGFQTPANKGYAPPYAV